MAKPRPEVIKHLSEEALKAMDGSGVDNLTAAEVASAIFTMARNVSIVMIDQTEGQDRENNRMELITTITELYNLVKSPRVN